MANLVVADTPDDVAEQGARWLADRAEEAVRERGRFDVALSGGTTPRALYKTVARLPLPWASVHLWFADERCVAPDDPESNFAMVRAAIGDDVPATLHRMEAERDDLATAAAAYGAALPAVLDAMVLGMGEDLHTCSLFPNRDWSRSVGARCLHVPDSPKPPADRLTLTTDVIINARALLVVVTGAGKAAALATALEGPERPDLYPVHLARGGTWLVDRAAAAALTSQSESSHG
jgi:6-phosphogluconolactonase